MGGSFKIPACIPDSDGEVHALIGELQCLGKPTMTDSTGSRLISMLAMRIHNAVDLRDATVFRTRHGLGRRGRSKQEQSSSHAYGLTLHMSACDEDHVGLIRMTI
jgi:hypothetical protein